MRRKHPPMPTGIRPVFWVLRALGTIMGIAGVVLAVLLADRGIWSGAVVSLGLAVTFAVATWLPPTSRWQNWLLVPLAIATSYLLQSWWVAAGFAAVFVWVAWSRRRAGPLPNQIEEVETDAVMRNATRFVEGFRAMGFRQVGAYRAKVGPFAIIVSVLISPNAKSYASVTDAVVQLTSVYADGRTLVTRNSNEGALPPDVLVNPERGAAPDELSSSHDRALATLAGYGHTPADLVATELTQLAIESELSAIEWMRDRKKAPRPSDKRPLWSRPDAALRISEWSAGS